MSNYWHVLPFLLAACFSVPQVPMAGLFTLARPASTNGGTPHGTLYPAIVTGGSNFPSVSMTAPTYRRDPPCNLF